MHSDFHSSFTVMYFLRLKEDFVKNHKNVQKEYILLDFSRETVYVWNVIRDGQNPSAITKPPISPLRKTYF